ncbi:hypothetical protein FDP41_002418 [Naegleria fowleri]|uniref:Pentacotripeptide-repeat region of PRORP domain-containing protein n=1 Tax=Naegleria fowleri TaxID=5763 RepID=A0A6A5BXZ9_NAEFO|nr:uncharacterized protein FDP41_002418 [Naegleria fowleri]KAF0978598.1 hypothetical protein FDP41_002418 [Naegleria fowleri]CAG4715902.1 unnamed protein product [Naegleria fowleri]
MKRVLAFENVHHVALLSSIVGVAGKSSLRRGVVTSAMQTHQFHTQSIVNGTTRITTRVTPTSITTVSYENPEETRAMVEKKYLRKAQTALDKRNPESVEQAVENIFEDLRIHGVSRPNLATYTTCINALVKGEKPEKAHKYYDKMLEQYSLKDIPFSLLVFMIDSCKHKREEVRAVDYFTQFKEKLKIHEEAGESIPNREAIILKAYTNLLNNMSNVLDKEKCNLYFEEFKSTYGEDKVDYTMYACMMKVNSFLQNYEECARILDIVKERVYTIIPSGSDMSQSNPSQVLTLFYSMMITACTSVEQVEIVRKQMEDEQISYNDKTYVNILKKYLQFDNYSKMYDLYENHLKPNTSIRAKEPVFFLLLEACYREAFKRGEESRSATGNEIYRKAIFDMHQIRRYWTEMRNRYGHKKPSETIIDALRKIVATNKQVKKEYNAQLKDLFKQQKQTKLEHLKKLHAASEKKH